MKSMIDRESIIDKLIEDDIDNIVRDLKEQGDLSVLAFILDNGFKGYRNYDDQQLIREVLERDL